MVRADNRVADAVWARAERAVEVRAIGRVKQAVYREVQVPVLRRVWQHVGLVALYVGYGRLVGGRHG